MKYIDKSAAYQPHIRLVVQVSIRQKQKLAQRYLNTQRGLEEDSKYVNTISSRNLAELDTVPLAVLVERFEARSIHSNARLSIAAEGEWSRHLLTLCITRQRLWLRDRFHKGITICSTSCRSRP